MYHSKFCEFFLEKKIHKTSLGENGLVGKGVAMRIRKIPVKTPPGAQSGLGTQPCYKAPGDLRFKIVKKRSN